MFSCKSFKALLFTFRTLVNLGFIFIYDVIQISNFILFFIQAANLAIISFDQLPPSLCRMQLSFTKLPYTWAWSFFTAIGLCLCIILQFLISYSALICLLYSSLKLAWLVLAFSLSEFLEQTDKFQSMLFPFC